MPQFQPGVALAAVIGLVLIGEMIAAIIHSVIALRPTCGGAPAQTVRTYHRDAFTFKIIPC